MLRCLLVVDFGDDSWFLIRKQGCAATQDFILATFHVNFEKLRRGSPASDELVQADCRRIYGLSASQHRAVSIGFNPAL